MQGQRRADVLLVVAADVVEDGLVGRPVVASGEPAFVLDDGRQPVGHARSVSGPRVAPVELLELLDRVGALADAHALAHDGVEVDEDLVSQQLVELGLAGGVLPDEPLEGRRLVGRVVVDVHVGEALPPLGEPVEQPGRQTALLGEVMGPELDELSLTGPDAREVLPARAPLGPRVALEVEVDVALVGLGQHLQAPARLGVEELVLRLTRSRARRAAAGPAGAADVASRSTGPVPAAPRSTAASDRRVGMPRSIERCPVVGAHARDLDQVVAVEPLLRAALLPPALPAVLHPRRLGLARAGDGVEQLGAATARVGRDVDEPPRVRLGVAGDDGQPLRGHALEQLEAGGIRRHLEQGGDLEPAGELGVGDVVAPGAEVARLVDAQQEVGEPHPVAVEERRLVDRRRRRAASRRRVAASASTPRSPSAAMSSTTRPSATRRSR